MVSSPINPPVGGSGVDDTRSRAVTVSADVASVPGQASVGSQAALNLAILESTQVSLGAGNEPLALVLKAAIDGINERLQPTLGSNALEEGLDSGVDISPEATAARIVRQSTGFFAAFQQQNQQLDPEQQLDRFLEVIGGGIEQGFKEAREILDGLQVLEGEVEQNIDLTFNLVQSGLENFKRSVGGGQ